MLPGKVNDMIYGIYAIQDLKSGFLTPNIDQNDATAARGFSYAMNRQDLQFGAAPADFRLMKLGTFDSETGRIVPADLIEVVCDGKDVVR